jgi:hypothetical protein
MRPISTIASFVQSRWRGEAPLATVFWRDTIIVGTALNVLTGLAAIVLLVSGVPAAIALLVHFSLLPWNVFLFLAVWRTAERVKPSEALFVRVATAIWFVLVIVL